MNAAEELKQAFPGSVESVGFQIDKPQAVIKKDDLLKVAGKVKEIGFDNLSVITGIDILTDLRLFIIFFLTRKGRTLF
jgi:hypothetical protein